MRPQIRCPAQRDYRKIRHSLQKCVESSILKTEFAV